MSRRVDGDSNWISSSSVRRRRKRSQRAGRTNSISENGVRILIRCIRILRPRHRTDLRAATLRHSGKSDQQQTEKRTESQGLILHVGLRWNVLVNQKASENTSNTSIDHHNCLDLKTAPASRSRSAVQVRAQHRCAPACPGVNTSNGPFSLLCTFRLSTADFQLLLFTSLLHCFFTSSFRNSITPSQRYRHAALASGHLFPYNFAHVQ